MHVLIVAHDFPPFQTISAIRPAKMAKYLSRLGCQVTVLTVPADRFQPVDPDLLDGLERVEIRRLEVLAKARRRPRSSARGGRLTGGCHGRPVRPCGVPTQGQANWPSHPVKPQNVANGGTGLLCPSHAGASKSRSILRVARTSIRQWIVPRGRGLLWYLAVRRRWRDLSLGRPDVVVSTSPPVLSLYAGRFLKERLGARKWVVDFRDLWVDNHYNRYGRLQRTWWRMHERRLLRRADAVFGVSDPMCSLLRDNSVPPEVPVRTVMNAFDEDDFSSKPLAPSGAFRVVMTGSLYGGKVDLRPLVAALGQLAAADPWNQAHLRLEYAGPDAALVRSLARSGGVGEAVRVHGWLSRADALRLQQAASVLVVVVRDGPLSGQIVTGKALEYLGAGRPILALVGRRGGALERLLQETGAGRVFCADELTAIQRQFEKWIREFRLRGKLSSQASPERVRKHTWACRAREVLWHFEEMLAES